MTDSLVISDVEVTVFPFPSKMTLSAVISIPAPVVVNPSISLQLPASESVRLQPSSLLPPYLALTAGVFPVVVRFTPQYNRLLPFAVSLIKMPPVMTMLTFFSQAWLVVILTAAPVGSVPSLLDSAGSKNGPVPVNVPPLIVLFPDLILRASSPLSAAPNV